MDARRQRIIVSASEVNLLNWLCLFVQAICILVAIGMMHSDNRPFTGEISVGPEPLLQVLPEGKIG